MHKEREREREINCMRGRPAEEAGAAGPAVLRLPAARPSAGEYNIRVEA